MRRGELRVKMYNCNYYCNIELTNVQHSHSFTFLDRYAINLLIKIQSLYKTNKKIYLKFQLKIKNFSVSAKISSFN